MENNALHYKCHKINLIVKMKKVNFIFLFSKIQVLRNALQEIKEK